MKRLISYILLALCLASCANARYARGLAKAEIEIADAPLFDTILVNDDLNATKAALDKEIAAFIG